MASTAQRTAIRLAKARQVGKIGTCARCGREIRYSAKLGWASRDTANRFNVGNCPIDVLGAHGLRPR